MLSLGLKEGCLKMGSLVLVLISSCPATGESQFVTLGRLLFGGGVNSDWLSLIGGGLFG